MSQYVPVLGVHDTTRDADFNTGTRGISVVYDPENPDTALTHNYPKRTAGGAHQPGL